MKNNTELSVMEQLDEQYIETENKKEIDYWIPLSKVIMESIKLRDSQNISQTELASRMKTRQSVISRFENMGRIPSCDFIARLATALGQVPGITLFGGYMAIAPMNNQEAIAKLAALKNMKTSEYVQILLNHAIENEIHFSIEKGVLPYNANTDYTEQPFNISEKGKWKMQEQKYALSANSSFIESDKKLLAS